MVVYSDTGNRMKNVMRSHNNAHIKGAVPAKTTLPKNQQNHSVFCNFSKICN